jgi:phosphopantothenoylcysteine decarboxylase/phosphopantothenate--cysteine ligase
MANGIADNMLITTYLSCRAPVFIAPAMDAEMYAHSSTRQNIVTLRDRGVQVIEAGVGELASHLVGRGRMEEPAGIVSALETYFASESDWSKRVLITAGPTYEKLDPVRFISNYSSGKMGYALAEACASRGASVELISGPVSIKPVHPRITLTLVESASEMYEAVIGKFALTDVGILCAAVSDYRPATYATEKIRHEENVELQLSLISNRDIAMELGKRKRSDQCLIGFALETDAGIESARKKLADKNLDLIVLNSLRDVGAGFRCDTNRVKLIYRNGAIAEYGLKSKSAIATEIVESIIKMC